MSKLYSRILFGLTAMLCGYACSAQVTVGATSYTTLKAAFDAINAGTHTGAITVNITGNTTETASASLNGSVAPANYTSIAINATATATVSMNLASAAVIVFNGADNVNLNGANTLTIQNTNATGRVIDIQNDATGNTIRNVTLKGATNVVTSGFPTAGLINFGGGTVTGNDNNTIDNCDVDGTGAAACLLFSSNTGTTVALENSGNVVKNSKFHDNLANTLTASIAIFLSDGNTDWTLQANSIYHTVTFNTASQLLVRGILILPDFTSDFHTVTGNFIGGNAASAAGTMTLNATGATAAAGFIGMDIETGGTGNTISNNTVRNITLSYSTSAGSFANAAIFAFIGGFNGTTTLTGNTISNLNFSNNGGFMNFAAVSINARVSSAATTAPTFTLTNNTLSNLTINAGAAGPVQAHGIRLETSSAASLSNTSIANPTFTVTGNTVSNVSVPFNGPNTFFRAIGTVLTQGGTSPALSTALLLPKADISNNTIHTISTNSGLSAYNAGAVTGIHYAGSDGTNPDLTKINQNTIYNLSANNAGDSGTVVIGILATTGTHEIQRNKIYDLKNAAVATTATKIPGIVGITLRSATAASSIVNNFISLGFGVTNDVAIFGILQNFNATGPVNVTHNSVVITGAGAAGNTRPTAAFARATEVLGNTIATPVVLRNNILYNSRTGGGKHYAIINTLATPATGWTSAYNNVYSATATTIALWGTTDINAATYNTNAADANSKSVTVTFANPSAGDLHLSGTSFADANLNAVTVAGVTVDFDGDTRPATPKMGADEPICTTTTITTQPTAQTVCTGGPLTLSVAATGASLTYQWRKGGNNIANATSATYTVANVAAADAGSYDVVVSSPCGNVTSTAVTVTVNPGVSITTQPVSVTACQGNATFTVAATGSGTLSYQWRLNNTNVSAGSGGTTNSYTVPVAAANAGTYTVVVTSSTCGSVTSNPATLTVQNCTSVPNVNSEVSSMVMMPNVVRDETTVRVTAEKATRMRFAVVDAQGRVVMTLSRQVLAGKNDIRVYLGQLSTGNYQLQGSTEKGENITVRFVKM